MVKRRINRTPKRIDASKEAPVTENKLMKKIKAATIKTIQRKRAKRTTASVRSAASKRKDPENVSMASRSSARSKGSNKGKSRKRDVKKERKQKREPKVSKSGKSTPVRMQKIDDFSDSPEEIKNSEIEKDERERLEREILFSKSALSHDSEMSIPVEALGRPLTRSQTKDYVHRRFVQDHSDLVIPKLNLKQAREVSRDDEVNSPVRTESVFSPIRDRLYTPMRNFARGITRSVGKFPLLSKNRQPHIDYEIVNVAFCIGIVAVCLAIWISNLLGKIPANNYKFTCDYRDLHLKYNSTDTIV